MGVFVFNQIGDTERRALRLGNVGSADGWSDVLRLGGRSAAIGQPPPVVHFVVHDRPP
jgi:hypothetical protein